MSLSEVPGMLRMETVFLGVNREQRVNVMEEIGECLRIWSKIMVDLRGRAKKMHIFAA